MRINMGKVTNLIVTLIGIGLIIGGVALGLAKDEKGQLIYLASLFQVILISVGASLIATSLVTFITNKYLMQTNSTKKIIDEWGLVAIYKTKADMNIEANKYLKDCKKEIDIVAIGMSGYLNSQGDLLRKKISEGVKIRIISCDPNSSSLIQREKDETVDGNGNPIGSLQNSVLELNRWISLTNSILPAADIKIKFLSTYPLYSYLRIDDKCFFNANLIFKQSQQNMAFEFKKNYSGYTYYDEYFVRLWESSIVVTNINTTKLDNSKSEQIGEIGGSVTTFQST